MPNSNDLTLIIETLLCGFLVAIVCAIIIGIILMIKNIIVSEDKRHRQQIHDLINKDIDTLAESMSKNEYPWDN